MASSTRRFKILTHLIAATEHQQAALRLFLEDPDLDAPVSDDPQELAARRKRITEAPTVMHPAFNTQVALGELERSLAEANTPEKRARVSEMAQKLVQVGLLDAETGRKFTGR